MDSTSTCTPRRSRTETVQRILDQAGYAVGPGTSWLRHPLRRHRTRAKLTNHFLPKIGAPRHVGNIRFVEQQSCGLRLFVVTRDAVFIEKRAEFVRLRSRIPRVRK